MPKYVFSSENTLDEGYKKITDIITSMRQDILYFYFRDKKFHKLLDDLLIDIDELIIKMVGKKDVQFNSQSDFLVKLDGKINKIYEEIFNKYLGIGK